MAASDEGNPEGGSMGLPAHEPADRDPVPCEVQAAANAAYSCRWVEANVATLVFDSFDGARREGHRHLVFQGEGLSVEVDVAPDRSVAGRLVPPTATEVVLRWPGGSAPGHSDERGCFQFARAPKGPATVRFPSRGGDGQGPVGTQWMVF